MVNREKEVILSSANGEFFDNPYIAKGIDEEGNLIVLDKTGKHHAVRSGEISVRGMLGYV
jgi:biotin-(acetyl-CoA carboxylase) ligase